MNVGSQSVGNLSRPPISPRPVGAVVVGGDYMSGLGIVRSLGRRGIPVYVAMNEVLVTRSRYCMRRLPWVPDARQQVANLLELGARLGLDSWTIFATGDNDAALLARNHAALSQRFVLTTPPWNTFRWAYDKRLTYRMAGDLGVDYPRTWYPRTREELAALDCALPVVLKPAVKEEWNRFTLARAWRADDRATLLRRYDEACLLIAPEAIMVQELIPGGGEAQFSFAAVSAGGVVRASLVARRLRQRPPDFGRVSTFVETVHEPELERVARRVIAAMGYSGLIEIEFKYDRRDNKFKLLDVNARAWAWHSLGRAAGVDFPHLLWQLLHGETLPETRARIGVRWLHLALDLPTAAARIRRGEMTTGQYVRSLLGRVELSTLAVDDPVPGVLEILMLARRRLGADT